MAIETTCGGCGKLLSVGDEHAGRRARCPECGQIYTVPTPNAPTSDSPVAAPPGLPVPSSGSSSISTETTAYNPAFNQTGAPTPPPPPPDAATPNPAAADNNQFWMRTPAGVEYGPVDRETLDRWFSEGRVGPGYMIRQSAVGLWQAAELSRPNSKSSTSGASTSGQQTGGQYTGGQYAAAMNPTPASGPVNPYSATNPFPSDANSYRQMYPVSDQSGLVLAFGILSWFLCPIFGILAWVMGRAGLRDIAAGMADPANKGLMQAGYYLGMVHVLLITVCVGGYIVFIAFAITLGSLS